MSTVNNLFSFTVPGTSPSILTLVSNTFTSITINWTYPNISDTDGYVVNASSLNDYVIQQVNGSSVNETTLNGLIPGTTYNITIRAYQDLLGPASEPLSVITGGMFVQYCTYLTRLVFMLYVHRSRSHFVSCKYYMFSERR